MRRHRLGAKKGVASAFLSRFLAVGEETKLSLSRFPFRRNRLVIKEKTRVNVSKQRVKIVMAFSNGAWGKVDTCGVGLLPKTR